MGWLDAPGLRLPVSSDPSFRTTRCVMLSTLCHTTICPAGSVAGFGEKDWAPLMPTTLIVTMLGGGVGVGGGVPGPGSALALVLGLAPAPDLARASAAPEFRRNRSWSCRSPTHSD